MGIKIIKAESGPTGAQVELPRKLWLTDDKTRLVEDGDPDARFLYGPAGKRVPRAELLEYGVEIVGPDEEPEAKEDAPAEDKQDSGAEDKGDGGEGPEEWTLSMDPATYLERYPDGPNAELAREHVQE